MVRDMPNVKELYYDVLIYNHFEYIIICSEKGLCYISSENKDINGIKQLLNADTIFQNKRKLSIYKKQLLGYFKGELYKFNFDLDLKGTSFQLKVWQELQKIPYGVTTTYQDIADKIGDQRSVRAVATAIGKNPLLIVIPCHRVIGKDGTLRGYREGLTKKGILLNLEKNFFKKYTSNENNKD